MRSNSISVITCSSPRQGLLRRAVWGEREKKTDEKANKCIKPGTPQRETWVKSSGWGTLEPRLLVPFTARSEMLISVFEIKQLEVQRMPPRWSCNVCISDEVCHLKGVREYFVYALTEEKRTGSCFSTFRFSKYAKLVAKRMEYHLKGAEAARTHEKTSSSKSKSNRTADSHTLSLSSVSWHPDIILTWIPAFIPAEPVSHRGSRPPESNAGE